MRIGINTGLVVVGAIGHDLRMDYTALGDTTNLAARLLNIAQPGQIALSGQHASPDRGLLRLRGPRRLPGQGQDRAGPRLCGDRRRSRAEPGSRSPGSAGSRRSSVAPPSSTAARGLPARRDGQGAIVLLAGEPGVGKSRLLYEFLRRLEDKAASSWRPRASPTAAPCRTTRSSSSFGAYLGLAGGHDRRGDRGSAWPSGCARSASTATSRRPCSPISSASPRPAEFLARLHGSPAQGAHVRRAPRRAAPRERRTPARPRRRERALDRRQLARSSSSAWRRAARHRVLLVLSTRPGLPPPWLAALAARRSRSRGSTPATCGG